MAFVSSGLPLFARGVALTSPRAAPHAASPLQPPILCSVRGHLRAKASIALVAAAAAAVTLATVEPARAALLNLAGPRPSGLGVRSERYLSGCPSSPNCICSQENVYDSHYVPSWTYAQQDPKDGRPPKTLDEAVRDLMTVIEKTEGEKPTIIEQRETNSELGKGYYVYAEFKTKTFGFVDDVEFLFNPDGKTVEYRSASRLGKDDLKANRNRIRGLRKALQEVDNRWASTGY